MMSRSFSATKNRSYPWWFRTRGTDVSGPRGGSWGEEGETELGGGGGVGGGRGAELVVSGGIFDASERASSSNIANGFY